MRTSRQLLNDIRDELDELDEYASAGGNREYAFDLVADTEELNKAHDLLYDFVTRIKMELAA